MRDVLRAGGSPEIVELHRCVANDEVERQGGVAGLHLVHDGGCPATMTAARAGEGDDVLAL